MKKNLVKILILSLFCSLFNLNFVLADAVEPCNPGSLQSGPPVEDIPSYDYDQNGFLQFHFQVKPEGFPFTGDIANLDYYFYNPDCSLQAISRYTFVYASRLPLIPNLIARIQEVGPDQYNFGGVNGDTGEVIDNAFTHLPANFSGDSVLSMKFYTAGNFGNPLGFNESWVFTPSAPVKSSAQGKTPVLIVPGVLGTEIYKQDELLWASILRMVNPLGSDSFMDPLAFNKDLTPLDNSLTINNVLSNPFNLYNYTADLVEDFKTLGYQENTSLFTFPYDWRYGAGDVNVQALKQKIEDIIAQTGSTKVDIIAHSTGGLILKKYVVENNDHHVGKAVFVGVPHLGAPKAIKTLLQGDNFGVTGLEDAEMKKISENMPVVYDLSPSQKYYAVKGSYVTTVTDRGGLFGEVENLDYQQTQDLLTGDHNLNAQAIQNARNLHTISFDNFDLRTKGVDVYNVVGCKQSTIGKIIETRKQTPIGATFVTGYDIKYVPGDETVPIESATNLPVDQSKEFFLTGVKHGVLMTANGSRQLIASLISTGGVDQNFLTSNTNVRRDTSACNLKGKAIKIFSPVALEVSDSNGNKAGIAEDGSIENSIDGVTVSKFGEHTFTFIPDDLIENLSLNIQGTGSGEYTLKVEDINNNEITQTEVFNHLPVTTNLKGSISLATSNNPATPTTLALDENGDGTTDTTMEPTATLVENVESDLLPPVTTALFSGAQGNQALNIPAFTGPVNINLEATDYAQTNVDPSGVFKIRFSLDGAPFITHTAPIKIATEGEHTIQFSALDLAGNEEALKTQKFIIDSRPPEFSISFNPIQRDLSFQATDDTGAVIQDNGNTIKATDIAGNTTELVFKQANRKASLAAELTGIRYNGKAVDISKNRFNIFWSYDKRGVLTLLNQTIVAKGNRILYQALYNGKQTTIISIENGKTKQETVKGLGLLKIITNNGVLSGGVVRP